MSFPLYISVYMLNSYLTFIIVIFRNCDYECFSLRFCGCSCLHVCAPVCLEPRAFHLVVQAFYPSTWEKRQVDASEFKASQEHLMRPISENSKSLSGTKEFLCSQFQVTVHSYWEVRSLREWVTVCPFQNRGQWISEYIHSEAERVMG